MAGKTSGGTESSGAQGACGNGFRFKWWQGSVGRSFENVCGLTVSGLLVVKQILFVAEGLSAWGASIWAVVLMDGTFCTVGN